MTTCQFPNDAPDWRERLLFSELRFKIHRMGAIGPTQVILIVLVVLLMFGGRKIPELMRGLGRGVKEFKDATQDDGQAGDDADKG